MSKKDGVDPFFTRESMGHTDAMHLAGRNPACPLLAPALHADLSGVPPMLLQARTNEVLLDDSARLAARARDADVDVILDVTAGVPHVFQFFSACSTKPFSHRDVRQIDMSGLGICGPLKRPGVDALLSALRFQPFAKAAKRFV
ncbi:hypothetical protein PBS_54360 [Paraburkholderia sp. 2C]